MSRLSPIIFEMGYKIEFQTAIQGHHIYKDVWVPLIGQELICKADNREEATEYDKNTIGFFKPGDPETLVGHLPIELSCQSSQYEECDRATALCRAPISNVGACYIELLDFTVFHSLNILYSLRFCVKGKKCWYKQFNNKIKVKLSIIKLKFDRLTLCKNLFATMSSTHFLLFN